MKLSLFFLIFLLLIPFFSLQAGDDMSVKQKPSGDSMLFDLLVLRPLGIATCVIGIAASIASAPFNLGNPDSSHVGKRLIEEPFEFTFLRPLGEINHGGVKNVIRAEQ